MSYFEHQGCQLYYEDHGQGAPLVLVHGLGSSARDWEYQLPALIGRYRVLPMEMPTRCTGPSPRCSINAATSVANPETL